MSKTFADTDLRLLSLGCLLVLSACGGGGDTAAPATAYSRYAGQCDPTNPLASTSQKTGSLTVEKQWMRAYFDDAYLWYDQVPSVDASAAFYSGPMTVSGSYNVPQPLSNYFKALKTTRKTASGALVDKFSFTYSTTDWKALSQLGVSAGYGMEIAVLKATVPRQTVIAFTDPGTPAANTNIARGAQVLRIDGVDAVNDGSTAGVAVLNAGLSPKAGTTHQFQILDQGAAQPRTVSLTAQSITSTPVQNVKTIATTSGNVGYLLFNDHIASAEQLLINAVNKLQGVSDLVIDMRYNGGGYLYVASELAYMIAGPSRAVSNGVGKTFEQLTYNDKRQSSNSTTRFSQLSCGLNSDSICVNRQPLPNLNLGRVFILTQGGTCSASESVINSLRGIGVTVQLIGGTTCGKPYGFTAHDNCGVSYFPIEFKGVNARGEGDYADGFAPTCTVADDYTKQLGDPTEKQLAAALSLRSTGACPTSTSASTSSTTLVHSLRAEREADANAVDVVHAKNPLRENRWHLPNR